ncbi:MAG: hypothetical protein AVO39_02500 [delta proteobacterium MLS_D]|jgi:peroxiredoxin|nr:MAG: hypothetical protein AVO39_02500 [delta proteobacterium MLS_D]
MKSAIASFEERKAHIVVVAPHGKSRVRAYWEKENLPFIGIPDPDGTLGKLYGQEWNLVKPGNLGDVLQLINTFKCMSFCTE